MSNLSTFKLVFEPDSITREELVKMLQKHTNKFEIFNFYPALFVGKNKVCFAVIELPESVIPNLVHNSENKIKSFDFMYSGNGPASLEEECGPTGCGGGGCGCGP